MIKQSGKIEKQIIKKITPTIKERKELQKVIEELKKVVKKEIKKNKLSITIKLVGSTAKDTFLNDNLDIDLFLLFPSKTKREELEKNGLLIGRSVLKNREEGYAEHPYIKGDFKGYKTEIVPCYKIEHASQKLSAVDRTPLHTKYIKKHLQNSQKQEVRLFKQYLKGINCYGAEAEIEGFSGYLCEILILKYSNFQKLIENSQNWKYGEKLSLTRRKILDFNTPLIFIDPVDNKRNVASALSKEKFNLFLKACKAYINNPSTKFFFPKKIKPWPIEKIKKQIDKTNFIVIKIKKPDIISENLYPQIRKSLKSIIELCKRYDFKIILSGFHIDNNINSIYFLINPKEKKLPITQIHKGPPVEKKSNSDEFIKKWKNNSRTVKKPYTKDNKYYVEIKREYPEIKKLLTEQLKKLSLGKHIDRTVTKEFILLEHDELLTDNLREFWTELFDNKMSWKR